MSKGSAQYPLWPSIVGALSMLSIITALGIADGEHRKAQSEELFRERQEAAYTHGALLYTFSVIDKQSDADPTLIPEYNKVLKMMCQVDAGYCLIKPKPVTSSTNKD